MPAILSKIPMTKITRLYAKITAAPATILPSNSIAMIHSSHPPAGDASIVKNAFGDATGTRLLTTRVNDDLSSLIFEATAEFSGTPSNSICIFRKFYENAVTTVTGDQLYQGALIMTHRDRLAFRRVGGRPSL
jgi:hypothetical protein